jgi:hypothetical protein
MGRLSKFVGEMVDLEKSTVHSRTQRVNYSVDALCQSVHTNLSFLCFCCLWILCRLLLVGEQ